MTNIGNQMITYLSSPRKSGRILSKAAQEISPVEKHNFYIYTKKLRQKTDYYLNLERIKDIWRGSNRSDPKLDRWIRILSAYFLRWMIPLSILTSKKMSKNSRMLHSRARKLLLHEIRSLN